MRALGYGTNAEIIDLFGEEPKLLASFGKDTAESYQDGLLELYRKIRPGEPLSVDSAESLLNSMFFDPRRYDLAKVGRYKFNKKLHVGMTVTSCWTISMNVEVSLRFHPERMLNSNSIAPDFPAAPQCRLRRKLRYWFCSES